MRNLHLMLTLFALLFNIQIVQASTDDQTKTPPSYTIEVTSPKNEQNFQNGQEDISVSVNVQPALEEGDQVAVFVDGSQVGDAQASTSFSVPRLDRGSHTIQAKVIQSNGSGASSETITIYQHRRTTSN